MRPWFRAVAVDYDGTLCTTSVPDPDVLAALSEVRGAGIYVVLVTGRIVDELRDVFPEVERHFDAIVAENGAVLLHDGAERLLAPPIPPRLADALARAGVPFRAGRALIATDTRFGAAVLERVGDLGLDCHLLHNRSALMVLPADVSKGSGLAAALTVLQRSLRDCIGIGDAENDHSLLEVCEVGVAVGDAVDALKVHADVVLEEPDGVGVARYLRASLAQRRPDPLPSRCQIELGTADDGSRIQIPGARSRLLIQGGSGSGKSYLAGLFAERVLDRGYTLCAIDPEGDHTSLGQRPGVIVVEPEGGVVPIHHVIALLARQLGSVVVDLSLQGPAERQRHARELTEALLTLQRRTGLPHWILLDEAHVPLGANSAHGASALPTGLCLVTWRPDWLCAAASSGHDLVLESIRPDRVELRRPGQPPVRFRPDPRSLPHQRHWHKYLDGFVPEPLRFRFRTATGQTGSVRQEPPGVWRRDPSSLRRGDPPPPAPPRLLAVDPGGVPRRRARRHHPPDRGEQPRPRRGTRSDR